MQVLVISPHSFVDLITNSSSELFVAETKKSVETVKEILKQLVRINNEKEKLSENPVLKDAENIFGTMFKEPERMEFTFEPEKAGKIWEEFDYVNNAHRAEWHGSQYRKHPVYERCHKEWYAAIRTTTKDNLKPQRTYDEVMKDWNDIENKAWSDILEWGCTQAGLPFTKNKDGHVERGHYARYGSPTEGLPHIAQMCDALSWDYHFKKGDIIIQSESDNTIPYEMFDDIERILNAHQRRHLG